MVFLGNLWGFGREAEVKRAFFCLYDLESNTPLPPIFQKINYPSPMKIVYGELREGGPVSNRGFNLFSAMMRLSSRVFSKTQSGLPMNGAEE